MACVKGRIIKGIAGFYYVYVEDIGVVECKAKGLFRNKNIKPLVGDTVELEILSEDEFSRASDEVKAEGHITEVLPRKNSLIRPASANIDQVLLVFAVADPEPHLNLLDRFLISMEKKNLPVIILFNKTDLTEEDNVSELRQVYEKAHYKTFGIQALNSVNTAEVRECLKGKTTILAGPSGVGKSTFMNLMQPSARMETGAISEKIRRGKNTTRHTELIHVEKDTFLLDSPGFSSLALDDIEAGELSDYYPEFAERKDGCRFAGCAHINEPDCAVKEALAEGLIAKERYENYRKIYTELNSRKKY